MVELTVALPVWNSKEIAWLAFESLCNQKKVDFDWELIVMEEKHKAFGQEAISEYLERLKKAGCVSVKYCSLDYKITLSEKWKQIALLAHPDSFVYVFCAADDYNEPNKLRLCYDNIKLGYDWVQYSHCLMYDIKSKKHMYYDAGSIRRRCGSIAACKTQSARNLPDAYKQKGIDHWLFDSIKPDFIYTDTSENWKLGFATDGYNTISITRKMQYDNTELPFFKTDLDIKKVVSTEVFKRLNTL